MKTKIVYALLAFSLAGTATAGDMPWVKTFAAALAKAKSSGKPVMIDFFTDS